MKKKKEVVDPKKNVRDFSIGMAGGAASAVVGIPFKKLTDPISSFGYHEALRAKVPLEDFHKVPAKYKHHFRQVGGKEGKMIYDRPFLKYMGDQIRSTLYKDPYLGKTTKEFAVLPIEMWRKGLGFGAAGLTAGALYRGFGDNQPVEKQGALQLIGNIFDEATRNTIK